jgi:uncharacterized protein
MYKWSIFFLKASDKNKSVLYNTLNSSVVVLEQQELETAENFILSGGKRTSLINKLIQLGFFVEKDLDQKEYFKTMLNEEIDKNKHFTVHILPTTGCNFACPYCYQSGIDKTKFLNEDLTKQTIKYITKYIKNKDLEQATIIIHGGEPTIYWKPVEFFLPALAKTFENKGISYRTQIVSNGYNLTSEKADLLSKYHWQRFQVTLDGLKETHNKRRFLKNGRGSFDQIMDNIKYVIRNNKIDKVSIRINYDKNNVKEIPKFLQYLSDIFPVDRIILSLGFISKTYDKTEANTYISKYGISYQELCATYLKLYEVAIKKGFVMPDLFMFDGMCTAKLDNAMVISSDGKIYKCLSGVGRKNFIEGDIFEEPMHLPNYLFLDLYDKCLEKKCEFIPLCNTGCRFKSYLDNGNIHTISCNREILEKLNKDLLKLKYLKSY